jgi:Secretion system C-terminal sorting domain
MRKLATLTLALSALVLRSNAQISGSNLYLQGNYVEIGMTQYATYGASSAPAGYHPHPAGGGLGFVADPYHTGWDTSTASSTSHYMGDYFYPGSPYEGWEIQIDTNRHQEFNMSSGSSIGTLTSYTTSGSKKSGTWVGTFDSIQISQTTTLDTTDLYFTLTVTMTNLSHVPLDNIYYLRTVDPDNDETWPGGSFVTNNAIENQSTDTTVVSATGTGYSWAYLALGTTDTNATALTYLSWPISGTLDLTTMYGETYVDGGTMYTQGSTNTGDYAIGLVTMIPHLSTVDSAGDSVYRTTPMLHPANSATVTLFYAFSEEAKDSAIARMSRPASAPSLNVNNVNEAASVKVYPNPSKDIVNISGLDATDHVVLYDMMGNAMEQNWNVTGRSINTFRYNNEAAGAYLLIVTDATGNIKARVSVTKL